MSNDFNNLKIQGLIAERISNSNEKVLNNVIDLIAFKEVDRRTNMIIEALSILDSEKKNLNSINNPDVNGTFDSEGNSVIPKSFSTERLNKINASKQKIEKLSSVIELCLSDNKNENYEKLKILTNQNNKNNGEKS